MAPGVVDRRTHTYIRFGTTSLFAALDIDTGAVIGRCYKRHRANKFLDRLKRIDGHMPVGLDVHIIMDNYATHKTPRIKAWLAHRPHWHVHFTPTSASWINQVERWLAEEDVFEPCKPAQIFRPVVCPICVYMVNNVAIGWRRTMEGAADDTMDGNARDKHIA